MSRGGSDRARRRSAGSSSGLGRKVIYADPLARELMENDAASQVRDRSAFGPEAYLPDGGLNRPHLADRIFSSSKLRKRMNGIVHPFVFRAMDRIIESELADRAGTVRPHRSGSHIRERHGREPRCSPAGRCARSMSEWSGSPGETGFLSTK